MPIRRLPGGTTTTTFETSDTSAAGHCQGLAMTFGKGRVVMFGKAAMLSVQIDAHSGLNVWHERASRGQPPVRVEHDALACQRA